MNSKSPASTWNHCIGRDDIHRNKHPEEVLDILFKNDYHNDVPKKKSY